MAAKDPRWQIDEHTRANHEVLVLPAYLDQWIPITGYASMKWWEPPRPASCSSRASRDLVRLNVGVSHG